MSWIRWREETDVSEDQAGVMQLCCLPPRWETTRRQGSWSLHDGTPQNAGLCSSIHCSPLWARPGPTGHVAVWICPHNGYPRRQGLCRHVDFRPLRWPYSTPP